MSVILYIFQLGIENTHGLYDDLGVLLTFLGFFDRHHVFDHALDVTAVFAQRQVVAASIVIHKVL